MPRTSDGEARDSQSNSPSASMRMVIIRCYKEVENEFGHRGDQWDPDCQRCFPKALRGKRP